jgi:hypothetical protein
MIGDFKESLGTPQNYALEESAFLHDSSSDLEVLTLGLVKFD